MKAFDKLLGKNKYFGKNKLGKNNLEKKFLNFAVVTVLTAFCCSQFAMAEDSKETQSSLNEAIKAHIVKCLAKDAKECSKAAVLFQNGIGVTQSNSQALAYFDKACALNSGTDCMRLADRYVVGDGVKQDSKTAFSYYKKACSANVAEACRNLGFMFELGDGTNQNVEKAAVMYQYACNLKNEDECKQLERLVSKVKKK